MTPEALAHLTQAELRAVRPKVGAEMRELIDAALAKTRDAGEPERPSERRLNQTERRWWAHDVGPRIAAGEIVWCEHEAMKLRVGEARAFYSPDFAAVLADGSLEITEVKGAYIREDARVKWEAAAKMYWFWRWRLVQWKDGAWRVLADYPPATRSRRRAP